MGSSNTALQDLFKLQPSSLLSSSWKKGSLLHQERDNVLTDKEARHAVIQVPNLRPLKSGALLQMPPYRGSRAEKSSSCASGGTSFMSTSTAYDHVPLLGNPMHQRWACFLGTHAIWRILEQLLDQG